MPPQTYRQRVKPLLGQIHGKIRAEHDKDWIELIQEDISPRRDSFKHPLEPVISTRDWRKEHPTAEDWELKTDMAEDSGASSDEEGPSRGHIQSSTFRKGSDGKVRKQSPTQSESEDAAISKRRRTTSARTGFAGTSKSSRARSDAEPGSLHDLFKEDDKPKLKTYGSVKGKASFLRDRNDISKSSGRKSNTMKSAEPPKRGAPKDSAFIPPGELIASSDEETPGAERKMDRMETFSDIGEDPVPKPRPKFDFGLEGSPERDQLGRIGTVVDFTDSESDSKRDAARRGRKQRTKKKRPRTPTPPPKAAFIDFDDDVDKLQVAAQDANIDLDNVEMPDTQAASSGFIDPTTLLSDEDDGLDADLGRKPKDTVCPWCGEPVAEEALSAFSRGKRMGVSAQQRFCKSHNKQAARELYESRAYPTIRWDELPSRIEAHLPSLVPVINNTTPSHFRDRLADKIAAGRDRAMKGEENLNPGYYGPRGLNVMCEILVHKYGKLLKEKAVQDRTISGRGSAYFIQSVLVAELACLLVGDDLGVGPEEARGVVEESREIGEMVHEEEG